MKDFILSMIGIFIGLVIFENIIEPHLPFTDKHTIKMQEEVIAQQDSIITSLRTKNDSLRITRAEFENAVKLLNEKK